MAGNIGESRLTTTTSFRVLKSQSGTSVNVRLTTSKLLPVLIIAEEHREPRPITNPTLPVFLKSQSGTSVNVPLNHNTTPSCVLKIAEWNIGQCPA
ncbi:hypothetical protein AVEN_145163-1 [Araneus ventricosus]|uniref:Uncharacterized protein n=1 Tax=Araneus ventricosus TaxID=182803 RepID=A0A4Y2R6H6_ARAVE|nr:hypothetical protein AVEN_145163-1 [Araneus ventricosus]